MPSQIDDIDRVIAEQTPWLATGVVPTAFAKPRERPLAKTLWQRLLPDPDRPRRFRLILGPRRVGKTTVMYQTVRHLLNNGLPPERLIWARLDHPRLMQLPLDQIVRRRVELAEATPAKPVFLFLDELTYADRWDAWLKTFYDDGWPVQILGTSSSVAALRHGRTESGVGRWTETYLPPLSFGEYLEVAGIDVPQPTRARDLRRSVETWITGAGPEVAADRALARKLAAHRRRYLLIGGFPELLTAGGKRDADLFSEQGDEQGDEHAELLESQRTLRSDAIERAIYKDIPQVFNITEPMKLERLLYSAAGQMGGLFSAESLAKEVGLSGPTIERHIAYLTQSYMIFLLTTYAGSEAKVQRRGRKLYFADGAVRNAALQRGLTPLDDPAEMGLLLENAVAAHLHALAQNDGIRLHHWREKKREVDFVYAHPDRPIAFEVTAASTHSLDSVQYLQNNQPKLSPAAYLVAPNLRPSLPTANIDGVGRMPLDWLLLILSTHAAAAISAA